MTTEIKFRTAGSKSDDAYYYVVPRDLELNQISIIAQVPGEGAALKVTKEA